MVALNIGWAFYVVIVRVCMVYRTYYISVTGASDAVCIVTLWLSYFKISVGTET